MRNLVVLSVVVGLGVAVTVAFAADAPKYTIKQVMKQAHKDGLKDKVVKGMGTADDAKKLLELYSALGGNKPPKGEAEAWKAKTEKIVAAAKGVVDGAAGSTDALAAATNCAACHKEHK